MKRAMAIAAAALLLSGPLVALGLARGWWRANYPSTSRFPIWGLDVSHHQKRIAWAEVVAAEPNLAFAYIKATEGGDWSDSLFAENWENARKAGLRVGAYHFFTFCRPAGEQARHFLSKLPRDPDALPPALDLEFGGNCRLRPDPSKVQREVLAWLEAVERAVGRRPVIYVTHEAFEAFFDPYTLDYPIWIRDVWFEPRLKASRPWTLWQFANRGRVRGINGFVDLNVFAGGLDELSRL